MILSFAIFLMASDLVGQTELERIEKTLEDYLEGTANGQPERVRNSFHNDLNLYHVEDDQIVVWDGEEYVENITPGMRKKRIGKILSIDYVNNAASAKIEIVVPDLNRIYTDYLLLLKVEQEWKIIHKSFTYVHYKEQTKYIFFLHNRFLEEHGLNEEHPQYGRTEYKEIVSEFERNGFVVISEIRKGNVNARDYAEGVLEQMDSLIQKGVSPKNITVVGTSKGGYIAQYVSTLANNTNLNFVFVASFQESDVVNIPDINYCGNILSIYDRSDPFGVSPIKRKENSTCEISHYGEVELDTKMGHGFLFKPLKDWLEPTMMWANGNFTLEKENLNSIY